MKQYELYSCPYNGSAKCDMTLSCKGCENFKPIKFEKGIKVIMVGDVSKAVILLAKQQFDEQLSELEILCIDDVPKPTLTELERLDQLMINEMEELAKNLQYLKASTLEEIEAVRSEWFNPITVDLPMRPKVSIDKKRIRSALPLKKREY